MSSISAKDRSQQTEELRRVREEYENQKAEQTKRHKRDLTKLQEKHEKEVDELRQNVARANEQMRNKHRDILTTRDERNIENSERLRRMHVETLRRKTNENEAVRRALIDSYEQEINKNQRINEQKRETLQSDFENSIQDRDRNYKEFVTDMRAKTLESLEDRSDKLNKKHVEEIDYIREERDDAVAELLKAKEKQKNNLQNQIKDMDRSHRAELSRKEQNWMKNYKLQEERGGNVVTAKDRQMQEERKYMQEDYLDKWAKKQDQVEGNWQNLREDVKERMDGEVNQLRYEVEKARNEKVLEGVANNRLKSLEKKHLIRDYEARMRSLEGEKAQILDSAKEVVKGRMENVLDRTQKLVQDTNRNHKMKQNVILQQAREDKSQIINNYENSLNHTNNRADQRVKKVIKVTEEAQRKQQHSHDANVDQLKSNYFDNLQTQREIQTENLKAVQARMEKKLLETQIKNQEKLDKVTEAYTSQIEQLQNEKALENKKFNELMAAKDKQREKDHRLQQEALVGKYEGRIATQEELHRKEIERLDRRHQEQMANLSARLNAYSKKA